jgi:hypothetical protein
MAFATINKGSSYFNTKLYTGTGASNAVTGVGFKPDWVWIKRRDSAASHGLFDINRGVNKQLRTNTSGIEETVSWFPSFDTDGFTVSTTESDGNASGGTYVAWNWLGSNTTTSNTSGSISSTVSVNQTAGFSIVSYTGNGNDYPTGATVGHGLGVAPAMIITKSRTEASTNWCVYHKSLPSAEYVALLNTTGAPSSGGDSYNRTSPTSTVFSVGQASGGSRTNGNGANYISYCFSEIKGFSKFGGYTGNGSTDGTFIYTGFKPAYIMIKVTSTADDWNVLDNKRDPENTGSDLVLYPDLNNSEGAATRGDFLSNGFKCRTTNVSVNSAGATYIYMAFAQNPFVLTDGTPVTAR